MAANTNVTLPANIQTALNNILSGVPGSTVRQAIVTALTWGIQNAVNTGYFINGLGLCIENGMLCYTTKDSIPAYSSIPSEISGILSDILSAEYGRDTRESIVKALKWGGSYASVVSQFISDLGLTVQNGKLCVIYYDKNHPTQEALYYESVYAGGAVGDEGIPYIGVLELGQTTE